MNGKARLVFVDGCCEIWYVGMEKEYVLLVPGGRDAIPCSTEAEAFRRMIDFQVRHSARRMSEVRG